MGWLSSRVVSLLDSGAERPGFKSQSRRCRVTDSLRQTVHTHCVSVHQAAKLVAALLRVAGVTAGPVESNGSLPSGLWFTSPAGWLPRTQISSGTLRSVIEYGLLLPFTTGREMSPKIAPPFGGSGPTESISQTAPWSVKPFCRAYGCDLQTHTSTDHAIHL